MKKFWSDKLFKGMVDVAFREILTSVHGQLDNEMQCCFAMRLYYDDTVVFDGTAGEELIGEDMDGIALMSAQMAVEQLTCADEDDDHGFEMCTTVFGNTLITYARRVDVELSEDEKYSIILSAAVISNGLELWDCDSIFQAAFSKTEDLLQEAYNVAVDDDRDTLEEVLREMSGVLDIVSKNLRRSDFAVIREALRDFRERIADVTDAEE